MMSAANDIKSASFHSRARRKTIADFFRLHREKAGLTLAQVAEALELDDVEVARRYDSGDVDLPLEDIFTLTNLFNIPPDDVVALILESSSRQEQT